MLTVPPLPASRLVLGCTGHRDLHPDDHLALHRAISTLLTNLKQQATPTLLTGLAEGADQLVARIALECGIPYVAIFPRPIEAYREDFTSPETRSRFKTLLDSSLDCIIAQPDPSIPGYTEQAIEIVRRSSAILALWDGNDDSSGTAQVVRLCRGPGDSARPVWWIKSRRIRGPNQPIPISIRVLGDWGNDSSRV